MIIFIKLGDLIYLDLDLLSLSTYLAETDKSIVHVPVYILASKGNEQVGRMTFGSTKIPR